MQSSLQVSFLGIVLYRNYLKTDRETDTQTRRRGYIQHVQRLAYRVAVNASLVSTVPGKFSHLIRPGSIAAVLD